MLYSFVCLRPCLYTAKEKSWLSMRAEMISFPTFRRMSVELDPARLAGI